MTLVSSPLGPCDHRWLRVVQPDWSDPLDMSFAQRFGGRWNPPGSWPTLYLSRDLPTACAQVERLLEGTPVDPEDLSDDAFELVEVELPPAIAADIVSEAGVRSAGLPDMYPLDVTGSTVDHKACWPVAHVAYDAGLDGVESRSACDSPRYAVTTEVAWWQRHEPPVLRGQRRPYAEWRSGVLG